MDDFQADGRISIRFAKENDAALIVDFIRGLAEYEKMLDKVKITEADIRKYVFEKKMIEVIIGECGGIPAGFVLFFHNFSTFLGRPGIFIEDIFVRPEFRGRGLGGMFFSFIAKIAVERDCGRMEWNCLDWNKPSIEFYKRRGASPMDEWTTYRVAGDGIKKLAENRT